ncbi:hypothetical protein HID58_060801 [Brassica napus]|uniref:Uncharacterized protein n=1 Tax=Brassica napus TaxID=3708 RepID=A0ABQ7ZWS6_BRANA|nr:hypothetical protein HID58_060801 [Brassica napus]
MSHHRSSRLASIPLLLLILSFPLASFIDTAGATLGSCRDVSPPRNAKH